MSRELRDRLEQLQVLKLELPKQTERVLAEAAAVEAEIVPLAAELTALEAELAELTLATMPKSELPAPPRRMPLKFGYLFAALVIVASGACWLLRLFV